MKIKILHGLIVSASAILVTLIVIAFTNPVSTRLAKTFLGDTQPSSVVRVTVDHGMEADKGSGCLIRADLILTCHHVIRDFKPGSKVTVEFKDGLVREATIDKVNKTIDLALLRIEPVIIPAASPARRAAIKRQEVVISGFPGGGGYSEVRGRVVGFRSSSPRQPEPEFFVVNNRAKSGMSGGPVFNMGGEVVGVLFGSVQFANCTGLDAIKSFLSDVK